MSRNPTAALLDKNLNADPNTNLNIIHNVLTNATLANSPEKSGFKTNTIAKKSLKTRDKMKWIGL